ncbi:hypothetical protein KC19_4G128700 [Ceratodon purpureus]|uniref:Uncharacterized protein n=1 Tax=Ceratodon purpureus TaxID=3225 RepID=A0A8T0I8S1_CERPU|nr:hypothetical protein KC19_4G128700 [Ceratodon purpureus]
MISSTGFRRRRSVVDMFGKGVLVLLTESQGFPPASSGQRRGSPPVRQYSPVSVAHPVNFII